MVRNKHRFKEGPSVPASTITFATNLYGEEVKRCLHANVKICKQSLFH